jgi:hypothetical protein
MSTWLSDTIAGTLGLRRRRDRGEAQGEHKPLHRTNPTTLTHLIWFVARGRARPQPFRFDGHRQCAKQPLGQRLKTV